MSRIPVLETLVGLFVILGVFAVFVLTFRISDLSGGGGNFTGYQVEAQFENIGGLKVGAPISLAGVRIGRVSGIHIDAQSFEAVVTMTLDERYNTIPDDSTANIYTAGLLGEQYIGLEAGGSERALQQGDRMKYTQSAFVLEKIIGQVLLTFAEKDPKTPPPVDAPAAGTP